MARIRLIAASGTPSDPLPEGDFAIALLRGRIAGEAPVLCDGVMMTAREALFHLGQNQSGNEAQQLAQTATASPRAKMLQH